MRSAYRITPGLAVFLAVMGVAGIGWVAGSTRAQEGAKAPMPEVPPPSPQLTPADPTSPTPLTVPGPQPSPGPFVAPGALEPKAADPAGPGNEDPEKVARDFVEQNRKVAQARLKDLKDEAEQLRARLGKVEAGIRRWEALLAALENSEKTAAAHEVTSVEVSTVPSPRSHVPPVRPPSAELPPTAPIDELQPIPPPAQATPR